MIFDIFVTTLTTPVCWVLSWKVLTSKMLKGLIFSTFLGWSWLPATMRTALVTWTRTLSPGVMASTLGQFSSTTPVIPTSEKFSPRVARWRSMPWGRSWRGKRFATAMARWRHPASDRQESDARCFRGTSDSFASARNAARKSRWKIEKERNNTFRRGKTGSKKGALPSLKWPTIHLPPM